MLALYLDGHSYEQIGERLGCDTKTVDNALQRVKRKVGAHLAVARRRRLKPEPFLCARGGPARPAPRALLAQPPTRGRGTRL